MTANATGSKVIYSQNLAMTWMNVIRMIRKPSTTQIKLPVTSYTKTKRHVKQDKNAGIQIYKPITVSKDIATPIHHLKRPGTTNPFRPLRNLKDLGAYVLYGQPRWSSRSGPCYILIIFE